MRARVGKCDVLGWIKSGVIVVATSPRITPASKNVAVKYHGLRQHVGKAFMI